MFLDENNWKLEPITDKRFKFLKDINGMQDPLVYELTSKLDSEGNKVIFKGIEFVVKDYGVISGFFDLQSEFYIVGEVQNED